jgi:hypothetical protein
MFFLLWHKCDVFSINESFESGRGLHDNILMCPNEISQFVANKDPVVNVYNLRDIYTV